MSQVDLDALEKLRAASRLRGQVRSCHITTEGLTHQANLASDDGRICSMRTVEADWFAAAHNALPALIRELRALRELVGCATRFKIGRCVVQSDIGSWWRLIAPGYGDVFATLPEAIAAARKWEAENA